MDRPYLRSTYREGVVAWFDWILVAGLVLLGVGSMGYADSLLPGAVALVGGVSFGFFVVVAELGLLGKEQSD